MSRRVWEIVETKAEGERRERKSKKKKRKEGKEEGKETKRDGSMKDSRRVEDLG